MKFVPHKYQEYAIERMMDTPALGLFLEMGLGKTAITLTAIDQLLFDTFDAVKVLVIAPLRVAEDTWSRESSKWDHLKHLRISKILGDRRQRENALKAKADLYIVNRENVPWLVGYVGMTGLLTQLLLMSCRALSHQQPNGSGHSGECVR
jgi:hypothetical protein